MMNEQNKANMSRLIVDLLGKGNLSIADELAVPDFVEHSGPPNHRNGVAGAKAMAQAIRTSFPDYQVKVENAISESDRVVLRLRVGGTHQGPLFGVSPKANTRNGRKSITCASRTTRWLNTGLSQT